MPASTSPARSLSDAQIHDFIHHGFIRIEAAFPATLAESVRDILWQELRLEPDDPATWTQPVIRLGMYSGGPFVEAANTPVLVTAYDQLVGHGRWMPPAAMGTFPIRFPSRTSPGDDGWHVDVSFDWHKPDFMDWRVNVMSRDRALLMLFLFSDVTANDAPTRIRKGSHRNIARLLEPAGEAGLTMRELIEHLPETEGCEEVLATGNAGDVYLCHPFVVHAAQPHRGTNPRFIAQPPLLPREQLQLQRRDDDFSPVEVAILEALGGKHQEE